MEAGIKNRITVTDTIKTSTKSELVEVMMEPGMEWNLVIEAYCHSLGSIF